MSDDVGISGAQRRDQLLIGILPFGQLVGVRSRPLEVIDVRDLADLHIRAMTAPEAAGQRFLGTGEFIWMVEMARILRENLPRPERLDPP
ncbi:MAG TPA: hypothetical protein VFE65_18420, partial [Pseudonocardia sp.]|nr:hypothetical protein [Pseudonocardia sp.]